MKRALQESARNPTRETTVESRPLHKTQGAGHPALWSVEHWRAPNNGNYTTAVASLRTANDSITRVTPLMIMLTPTRMPIASPTIVPIFKKVDR